MATITRLLTAEEFADFPPSRWSELIDGMVVEMSPPAPEHGGGEVAPGFSCMIAEVFE